MITNEIIYKYRDNVEFLYSLVITFEDFQLLNIAFLKNKIPETIYHGPLEDETNLLLKDLLRLNKRGFITINSQPGLKEKDRTYGDKEYFESEQKEFIEGFCHKDYLQSLISVLSRENVYFRINNVDDDDENLFLYYDNFPKCPYNITRYRSHPDHTLMKHEPWILYTNIPREIFSDKFGTNYYFWDDMIYVIIAGKNYCDKINISNMVLKVFKDAKT